MKLKLLLMLLILIPSALAIQYNHFSPEELKTLYNNNLEKVPGFIKTIIGSEAINLYYTSLSKETTILGIRTYKAKIISFQEKPFEEPTMNIYVSEDTVEAIRSRQMTLQYALKSGRIRYESLRFKTKLKMAIAKPAIKILGWFA